MLDYILQNIEDNTLKSNESFTRVEIEQLLSQALDKPLVTVTATTGYGKTLTVSSYLAKLDAKTVWIQLQKLDNIATRFWNHFIESIFKNDSELYERFISLGFPSTLSSFDQFLHMGAEVIDYKTKYIIVFDDFYLIEEEEIQRFIEKLVLAKLINISIVVLLRKAENFKFSKIHSKDIIYQITEDDLRYTYSETVEYFKFKGLILDNQIVTGHYKYTNGWPLALYLISIKLSNNKAISENQVLDIKLDMFNIIEKEIFSPCSYQLQNFLIKLSLLDIIPQDLLKELIKYFSTVTINMFNDVPLVTLDYFTKKYSIHNIFLDYLRQKKYCLIKEEINEIYLITANWYKINGYKVDAINYYRQCNNYEEILAIAIEHKTRCSKSIADMFISAIDDFPQEFIDKNPIAYAVRAKFLLNNTQIEEGYYYLTNIRLHYESLTAKQTYEVEALGEIYIILALLSCMMRNFEFIELFKMAADYLPNGSKVIDTQTELNGGNIVALVGKEDRGNFKNIIDALFVGIPFAANVMNGCGMGLEYLAATELMHNMGDLKNAEKNAYQAIYNSIRTGQQDIEIMAYFFLLRISISKGLYEDAISFVQLLTNKTKKNQSPICLNMIDVATSWFYAVVGDFDKVKKWILSTDEDDDILKNNSPISVGVEVLVRARCYINQNKYDDFLVFYDKIGNFYGIHAFLIGLIIMDILKSICLFNTNKVDEAMSCFENAYHLSTADALIMPFMDFAKHLMPIVRYAKENNNTTICPQWLNTIYQEMSAREKHVAHVTTKYNLSINKDKYTDICMTKQEIQILNNLCRGYSKKEVAIESNLSLSILKSVLNDIYSKLGATNRVEAVRIATSMSLYKTE